MINKDKTEAAKILLANGWNLDEVNALFISFNLHEQFIDDKYLKLDKLNNNWGQKYSYQDGAISLDCQGIARTPVLGKVSFEVPNSGVGYAIRGKKNSKLKGVKFK